MAYTVVVALKQAMERLLNPSPSQSLIHIPNSEMHLIYKDLCYLKSFFDRIKSLEMSNRVDVWEKQIKDVVQKTRDLIESHVADQFRSESESSRDEGLTSAFSKELLKLKQELSDLTKKFKTEEEFNTEDLDPDDSFAADAVIPRIDSGRKNKMMVGMEETLIRLLDRLAGGDFPRRTISIVGMAGMGKTAIARRAYEYILIVEHFDIRLFVTIGVEYQLKEFLVSAVSVLGRPVEGINERTLGESLHKSLFGRRYLIVLDDVWDIQVLEELRYFFPDNNNGSRILLTTRLLHVASMGGDTIQIQCLSDEHSWYLLREMVFPTESCPPEFERVGKEIARSCRGLPLAITVIGGLLCKTSRTVEHWKNIAENVNAIVIGNDADTFSKALSLSYKHLPQQLKVCFLYMGVFPENYEIPVSELIKLWVSEGILEPQRSKSLEEVVTECLDDLLSRSLILVLKLSSRGMVKTCGIHSFYRDLCVRKARSEKFFHVMNEYGSTNNPRRLCIHNNIHIRLESSVSVSSARSLLCFGSQQHHPSWVHFSSRLLRVIHAPTFRFNKFPDKLLELARLKHLAITIDGELPASISKLRNLEVLIVYRHQSIGFSDVDTQLYLLPVEFWNLRRLRHLKCMGFHLLDPSSTTTDAATRVNHDESDDPLILENLLTLSGVTTHAKVLSRMPNLIKLDVRIVSVEAFSFDGDLVRLNQLESFKCLVVNPDLSGSQVVVSSIPRAFPSSLRKTSLSGCGFSWNCMSYIGSLPHLEVLKLGPDAFRGPVWRSIEGEFCRLKSLLLDDLDIQHWIADSSHFPVLESLIIRHCRGLEEIPSDIGDIPTLRVIRVIHCSDGVAMSAVRILEEQESFFNEDLQVRIEYENEEGVSLIEEKIEDELGSFINSNLQITSRRY